MDRDVHDEFRLTIVILDAAPPLALRKVTYCVRSIAGHCSSAIALCAITRRAVPDIRAASRLREGGEPVVSRARSPASTVRRGRVHRAGGRGRAPARAQTRRYTSPSR